MKDSVKHIVEAFLARQEQSITGYGQLFAACLAEFWPESDPDSPACHDVCVAVAETFRRTLSDSIKDKKDYVRAFGCFLTRELLSDTTRDGGSVVFDEDGASLTLFDYTKVVAAKFWWHASTHCEKSVDRIVKHSQSWSGISYNAVGDAINDLCLAFNSLQELRRRINLTENALRQHKGVSSSANLHWKSEHMSVLLDRFATGIALLAEALEKVAPNTGLDIRLATELEAAWQNLKPQLKLAFDDIYPQLCSVAQDRMHRFVASTQLPHSALLPADIQVATTDSRVFVPSVVLESFFDQAMRNLLTSAYANWTEEQKSNDAIVKLSIKPVKGSTGDQFLEVVIADNGPIHNGTKIAGGEHGRALLEIDTAVREYGGRLDRPTVADGFTNVRLLLRHRVLETQE